MVIRDEFYKCETDVTVKGKVAIVTGATSGTGLEVAKNLVKRGAKVIITERDSKRLQEAGKTIRETTRNGEVVMRIMDFGRLATVRDFARKTVATEPRVDILINNIGAIGLPDTLTQDNLHMMMQVNYYGTFLQTYLLLPLLKSSAPSRIINISSLALILGIIDLKHMNDIGRYSNFGYYCNAKLAEVLFTVELDKQMKGTGVSAYSMDPGLGKSNFFRNLDNETVKAVLNKGLQIFGLPLERVATLPVYLAVDPRVANFSGKLFRYCETFYSSWFADDENLTRNLWDESKRLLNLTGTVDFNT
ncbi:retinol dehydrogenase 13-like [Plodia interpunctella]|uniref:retinol dehydrogenase 13-like n=1 Tax=Plodia interpunctella TaxID=58824 RepID=UPI0023684EA6|nr:retinol dehydrogenase 13-like [Plodia interpunctella]XP_053611925.1 retinol dehydrogenase 13-like [Plodia interpunctella]